MYYVFITLHFLKDNILNYSLLYHILQREMLHELIGNDIGQTTPRLIRWSHIPLAFLVNIIESAQVMIIDNWMWRIIFWVVIPGRKLQSRVFKEGTIHIDTSHIVFQFGFNLKFILNISLLINYKELTTYLRFNRLINSI